MWTKIKGILGSIRFWLITLFWLSTYIAKVEVDGFLLSELFNQIGYWLGSVAGVGTVDQIAKALKEAK
jgi:hypothetical protein